MRDIAVTLAVFGCLPFVFRRPWLGILVWSWLGFMNPHRLAWGFSTSLPFAMIVAMVTLVAMFMSREPKKLPWTREAVVMLVFLGWMLITSSVAMFPDEAWPQFEKVAKIFFMIFIAMMLINNRERLHWLVVTIALSIGFYGVKGGIFTVMTGGAHHVRGPAGTFIDGNNEIGLALVITIPLLYYVSQQMTRPYLRYGLIAAMVLCALAALGTQSRGAMLALSGMSGFLWLKSRNKLGIGLLLVLAVLVLLPLMPDEWYQRMSTIKSYDEDASALGRINAWTMAFNLAKDRITGGGFETFQYAAFLLYAPVGWDVHDAHSIYFEVLGEHGFPGLAIFLALGAMTWFSAAKVARYAQTDPELKWLRELMAMVQVALMGYLMAGTFLGMAYFDYYYNLVLIVVVARALVAKHAAPANVGGRTVAARPVRVPPGMAPGVHAREVVAPSRQGAA